MRFNRYLIGLAFFGVSSSLLANPIPEGLDSRVTQQPGYTEIHQSNAQEIFKWRSFNIAADEHTHFEQPANGVALNRIDPHQGVSQIFGHLSSTGQIILVNQAGIYFGPSAHVDVGGLIASTSDISEKNFLAGHYIFDQPSSYADAAIINKGHIQAADYGLVALLGTKVVNEGYIQANLGHVILASGNEMTVDLSGDQLFYFGANQKNTPQGVTHSGTIVADGGRILLTAQNAQTVLDNAINVTGVLQARSVSEQKGEIILSADPQSTVNVFSGKLNVSGEQGGTIKILSGGINLLNANLNADGNNGGGEILIGGNVHGEGLELHAKNITIDDKTLLSADALTLGQGGKIVAWSDGYTQAYGNFSARGGLHGGDGGFIETSGHLLNISGIQINTSAPRGHTGLWLLDPCNVTIQTNGGVNTGITLSNGVYTPNDNFENATIDVGNLVTALNSSNIQVITTNTGGNVANGSITVASPVLWSSGNTLTLTAVFGVNINSDVSSSGGGSLVLSGPTGVSIASTLGANGALGSLTVTGATTITGGSIRTSGNQTYNSAVTVSAATTMTAGSGATVNFTNGISGSSALSLTGAGQYNFSGSISNSNISVAGSGATILNFTVPIVVQMTSGTAGSVVGILSSFSNVSTVNSTSMTLELLGSSIYNVLFTGGGAATLDSATSFTGISSLIGNGSTIARFLAGLVISSFTSTSFTVNGVQTSYTNVVFPQFSSTAVGGYLVLADGTLINLPSVLSQMNTPPTSTTASNTPSAVTDVILTQTNLTQQTVTQMTQNMQTELYQDFQQSTLTGCA